MENLYNIRNENILVQHFSNYVQKIIFFGLAFGLCNDNDCRT